MATNKSEVTTRIEEENKGLTLGVDDSISVAGPRELSDALELPKDSDEEAEIFKNFHVKDAWQELINLPGCHQIMINEEVQKKIEIQVGVNVSQEFPWKQIKYKILTEHLFDEIEDGQDLHKHFEDFQPDDLVLIGYVPTLTQNEIEVDERDPFITFVSRDTAKYASQIIRSIETYEKWTLNKILYKKGHLWKTKGSEKEVDLGIPIPKSQIIDVELQSVFPLKFGPGKFDVRKSSDVRDGYVELLPGDKKFENVHRKRINAGVQAIPAKISLEQQTDPTFPTNAWSQYLYEITEDDDGLDVSSEEEGQKPSSKKTTPTPYEEKPPVEPPEVSDQIKNLMETLEFNQIDMYRNDYSFISSKSMNRYSNPYLEEILCFADLKETLNQKCNGIAWYPTQSGLVATTYTFYSINTSVDIYDKTDNIARISLSQHPTLLWSFSDSLRPKLKFLAPRDIYSLSFCPYCPNILIGGSVNGQIFIWDLEDRIEKLEYEEMLTTAQIKYRSLISEFFEWAKPVDEQFTINPIVSSAADVSPSGAITNLLWLNQQTYMTADGKIHKTTKPTNRFFMTNSVDGSVAFWDLDINLDKKIAGTGNKSKLPPQLMQNESALKKYDRIFKPVFMICFPEPITATLYEMARFKYIPYDYDKKQQDVFVKFPMKVVAEEPRKKSVNTRASKKLDDVEEQEEKTKDSNQCLLSGSLFGSISSYSWEGLEYDLGDPVNKEKILSFDKYSSVHDGPIFKMETNPHCPDIFVTIGRHIMAIWRDDFFFTPILWRKRPNELTAVTWSLDRPAVLFLSRSDGYFEAWDILARDDKPMLDDVLSGGLITALSEHRPSFPKKVLCIGDYIGCLKMISLPKNLQKSYPDENQRLDNYINSEKDRKESIREWENNWLTKNADIIDARKAAEEEAKKELEAMKKAAEEKLKIRKTVIEVIQIEPEKKKGIFDLPEKLEKKWDEMNMKRLLQVLMIRKMVNAKQLEEQTKIEKKRLAYEKSKKIAFKRSLRKIDDEVAAIRSRILPTRKVDVTRNDMILESVNSILMDSIPYEDIEKEAKDFMEFGLSDGDIEMSEFHIRGQNRRIAINRKLGGNRKRTNFYETMKIQRNLSEFDFGYDRFFRKNQESEIEIEIGAGDAPIADYSDLDSIPVRDESN